MVENALRIHDNNSHGSCGKPLLGHLHVLIRNCEPSLCHEAFKLIFSHEQPVSGDSMRNDQIRLTNAVRARVKSAFQDIDVWCVPDLTNKADSRVPSLVRN